jgi:L-ascorbate metabolism protein UlaG (beta-lactamase superfamily)
MYNYHRIPLSVSAVDAIQKSLPPFDNIDILLFTHDHADHFYAPMVSDYLKNNPKTSLVSTPDVVDQILNEIADTEEILDQIYAIGIYEGETESVTIGDIVIEAYFLTHGLEDYQNYGYLFSLGGITFFHTGDMVKNMIPITYLQDLGLPDKGIDVAFIPEYMLFNGRDIEYVQAGFNPTYMVPMHIEYREGLEEAFDFENALLILDTMSYAVLTPDMFGE